MLQLKSLKVKSFVTREDAKFLAGGALAVINEVNQVKIQPNQSAMDCPTEPVLCPP